MPDIASAAALMGTAGVASIAGAFINSWFAGRSKSAETTANNEAKLKVHGDDLLLKIMEVAEAQNKSLAEQLAAKAGIEKETHLLREHVSEAMAYMRALIAARRDNDEQGWLRAERAALQWITQMQRTFDARGALRQEDQLSVSARQIAARAVVRGIKGMQNDH